MPTTFSSELVPPDPESCVGGRPPDDGAANREVVNLRNEDVDLQERSLRVRAGKENKDRVVYFNADLRFILTDYQTQRRRERRVSSYFLFSFGFNRGLRYKNPQAVLQRVSSVSGVHVTAHMLRHTCFSILAEQNVSIAAVQAQAGHSLMHTTHMYVQMSESSKRQAINRVSLAPVHRR